MNEFTLRFLVVGGILAVLIGFGIWWFFVHSSTDRIAEQNGYNFYKAVEYVCETGNEKELKFELQQNIIASLKDEIENGINWVKKKIGIGGPELEIPIQTYNDPYYMVYWEQFPPEPPYQFGQGVIGTAASVFMPWSEDLPWSSNFLMTVTLDSMFLGLDIFGIKEVKEFTGRYTERIAQKIADKIESISPETLSKLQKIWNAIENGGDAAVEKLGKAEEIVVKGGKFVVKEGKFIGKVTAGYTMFCLVTSDKTLGDCLKEGVVVGLGADVAKITLQKFVVPKVNAYLKEKIAITKTKFSTKISDIKDKILSYFKEEVEDSFELKDLLKEKGWEFDESTEKLIASRDSPEALENIINPLEEYLEGEGYPDKVDDIFTIVYEKEDGKIVGVKEVIVDKKGMFDKLKEKITLPFTEKIGRLEENVMSDKVLDSGSFSIMAKNLKSYFEENPEEAVEFLTKNGVKVSDSDEALRLISLKLTRLQEEADEGLLFIVVEKGSKMENLIDKLDDKTKYLYELWQEGKAISDETILHETKDVVSDYLKNDVLKDKEEAKNLWNLLNGKRLRLKEDVEVFSRGSLGYAILRIQDLYTPLGATYWDKYFSYYGYPSKLKPPEGYCQTSCQDGAICVQLGACVRAYPLPEACAAKGIQSIKLKRNSVVAPDPRFYLVSPCYSKLKIYQEGDTIYVEPYMVPGYGKKNYCYATAGLVNWYVGMEAGEYVAKCISSALCGIVVSTGTAGGYTALAIKDIIAACFGIGKLTTPGCSTISELVGLLMDVYRETQFVYPDAYANRPDLIDFKIASLN